ncbi:protein chibby homolog 1 isoform X3 [Gorilla gorilla gorilla]|uniref:protein chibby homolog 1 isoform X3 n=1 Tax=Gorilla gorilla gorilla TaxID=9595 RepID=UPI00244635F7|nr:protein chibby homolog 1 isoform X4 [Gorilla gorilla gorilla]
MRHCVPPKNLSIPRSTKGAFSTWELLPGVLIHFVLPLQITTDWVIYKEKKFIWLTVLETGKSKSMVQVSGEGSIGFAFIRPKMPFFGNTFSPKKTPPRKSASLSNLHSLDRSTREVELGLEYGSPTMNLAGQSLKFENGQWIAETGVSGGVDRREVQRLRRRNQQLEEENNLLRLKVDILLDMLSESTAESHLMEKELDELRISRKRK